MYADILNWIYLILCFAVIPVYAYLGYKLKRNIIISILRGLAALFIIPLIVLAIAYTAPPSKGVKVWPILTLIGPVLSLSLAAFEAYKNGLFSKRTA